MIRIFLALATTVLAVVAEPSAFRAGDINAKEPYGLTAQEKAIHANKKSIEKLEKQLFAIEQKLDKLSLMLEGSSATTRSNSETIRNLMAQFDNQNDYKKQNDEATKKLADNIELLHKQDQLKDKQIKELQQQTNQNQKKLADQIALLQKSTVNKEDIQKVLKELAEEIENNRNAINALGGKKQIKKDEFENQTPDSLLSEVKNDIESKKYDQAQKKVNYMIEKKYNLPESYFYLGSIYYFKNDNQKAISAFKESAKLDENAKHMPVLLFYSAISLEREKNSVEAKKFYETLLSLYPDHAIAESAKKRLEKIK